MRAFFTPADNSPCALPCTRASQLWRSDTWQFLEQKELIHRCIKLIQRMYVSSCDEVVSVHHRKHLPRRMEECLRCHLHRGDTDLQHGLDHAFLEQQCCSLGSVQDFLELPTPLRARLLPAGASTQMSSSISAGSKANDTSCKLHRRGRRQLPNTIRHNTERAFHRSNQSASHATCIACCRQDTLLSIFSPVLSHLEPSHRRRTCASSVPSCIS